jgi:rfaE bifunctional protein nucleotidyltransferase chain/domain
MNHQKIKTKEQATHLIGQWKSNGERIVFTNGCFDLLHAGHVHYLTLAKKRGDRLVVGINSDESIKRIKGPNRPVISLSSRSVVLASLEMVDIVVPFEAGTPIDLIEAFSPDVLIQGSDYIASDIVGADFVEKSGGSVETIQLLEGFSTSEFIKKIINSK